MPWTDAFRPIEEANRETVLENTWGDLAPEKNMTYPGKIVWGTSAYAAEGTCVMFCEFEGLDDSPWFYDVLQDFVCDHSKEDGCIYEFTGHFRNYKFVGKVRKVQDYNSKK